MYQKISLLLLSLMILSACASGVSEAERLEKCVVDGTTNDCELKTLEYGQNN